MTAKGILLINLGTPSNCDTKSVRRYLAEFLMDPYVIDIPLPFRLLLVKGVILNTRPKQSAAAYQRIWTDEGSPLLTHTLNLAKKLQRSTDDVIAVGMRYGEPSIKNAVKQLKHCSSIHVIPLYPQYSQAATQTAIDEARKQLEKVNYSGLTTITREFFSHPEFITAQCTTIQSVLTPGSHLLLSYHGLPVKQLNKVSSCANSCSRQAACPAINDINRDCYRAQCYATSTAIANQLGLSSEQYSVAFQSRLGKLPWIQPYTTDHLNTLRQRGIKNLCIACPSFFVDCLETLDEIGNEIRELWHKQGGDTLQLIPCLNDSDQAITLLKSLLATTE
jgi:protoporphyrin/coproporphyrin ferrochelatase